MRRHDLTRDTTEQLLAGDAVRDELPESLRPLADTLDGLRNLRAEPETSDVRHRTLQAMAQALVAPERPRPRRLVPAGVRLAFAVLALAVLGTTSVALAGGGVPGAGVAQAVLSGLGLDPEDERDRAEDQREREEDLREREEEAAEAAEEAAEHEAEGEGPLPGPAQEGRNKADRNRAVAQEFVAAMRAWTDCVAEEAPKHESSGATGGFDPVAACGEKPHPSDFGVGPGGEEGNGGNGAGRSGPPAGAGPPTGAGPPANAGPPSGAGPPATAGPPQGAGPPSDAGPPAGAGPPAQAGAGAAGPPG